MDRGAQGSQSVTELLKLWRQGDSKAHSELMDLLYPELRRIATRHMGRERANHTLRPTALVNEAYLRLRDQKRVDWRGRTHFLAVSSAMMRRILVEHARGRDALKRRAVFVPLSEDDAKDSGLDIDILALDGALQKFEGAFPMESQVVQMRFFGGLTIEEVAEQLGVGHATVERAWTFAKAWLFREVNGSAP